MQFTKFFLFVFLLYLLSNPLLSQPSVQFKWSNYHKIKKYSHCVFIYKTEISIISIIKNAKNFELMKYDTNLKVIAISKFRIDKGKENIIGIWGNKNKIYIATTHDLKNQRQALKVRIFNIDSLQNKAKGFNLILLNENRFSRDLYFRLNEKDTFIEIFHPNIHQSNDENLSITYYTYSRGLKLLDKAFIEIPFKYTLCEILKAEKTDSAGFFICTKQFYTRPIEKRGMAPNYYLGFYIVNPNIEMIDKYYMKAQNNYIDAGRARYNKGVVEAIGFFSQSYQGGKQGIWNLKYDFNKQISNVDTFIYFNEKIKNLPSNGYHKSIFKKYNFESFFADYLINDKQGKRIFVGEQFMLVPASFGSAYTYNRFYGDILILYIDKNQNIYNCQRIVKSQNTFNNSGEFSSYFLERKDSVLYFFYNDNINSVLSNANRQLVWHKHSCLILLKAGKSGVEKRILADYSSIGGIIQIRDMFEIDNNRYLVYARKKNKTKLGILTYFEN